MASKLGYKLAVQKFVGSARRYPIFIEIFEDLLI